MLYNREWEMCTSGKSVPTAVRRGDEPCLFIALFDADYGLDKSRSVAGIGATRTKPFDLPNSSKLGQKLRLVGYGIVVLRTGHTLEVMCYPDRLHCPGHCYLSSRWNVELKTE